MFEQHATHSIDAEEAYRSFGRVGLEYGPTHRTLAAVCSTEQGALARLYLRSDARGTPVHPADLDGALQLTMLLAPSASSQTRLPFAASEVMLIGGRGCLWPVRHGLVTSLGPPTRLVVASRSVQELCAFAFAARASTAHFRASSAALASSAARASLSAIAALAPPAAPLLPGAAPWQAQLPARPGSAARRDCS